MSSNVIALLFALAALGVAAFAVLHKPEAPAARTSPHGARIGTLESEVAAMRAEIVALRRDGARLAASASAMRDAPIPADTPVPMAGVAPTPRAVSGGNPASNNAAMVKAVDAAVERKTKEVLDELRLKANKKPEIAVLAKVLELNKEQQAKAEQVVRDGQRDVYAVFETPTADGTNLMDQLVDVVAKGMAQPGKDHGWGYWVGRAMKENIPGTNQTYAARAEEIKQRMRKRFQEDWTPEQYREYQEWGIDPTEIASVPDAPRAELVRRIQERARAFGADIPQDDSAKK